MSDVAHANALRGAEFRELATQPKTWILIVCFSVALGVAGAMINPLVAAILFIVTFLTGIAVTFFVADQRSAQAFYTAYADARGLTKWTTKSLGRMTPLLRRGDKQRVDVLFEGELAPGVDGQLVLWNFIVESRDGKGNTTEVLYPYTLVVVSLPETLQHLRELRVQRQAGFKSLEKFEDAFRRSHERVTLESTRLGDRYEIFRGKGDDEVWVRRLFSPSFIVWLAETPPEKFGFELENGWLCAYSPKHRESAEGLDEMVSLGCTVAARIREEAAQSSSTADQERAR